MLERRQRHMEEIFMEFFFCFEFCIWCDNTVEYMQAFQQFYHLLLCLKICWLVFYKQITFAFTKKQASTKIFKSFYSKYFSDIITLIFFTRVKTISPETHTLKTDDPA
jgi:hypothetical protein